MLTSDRVRILLAVLFFGVLCQARAAETNDARGGATFIPVKTYSLGVQTPPGSRTRTMKVSAAICSATA